MATGHIGLGAPEALREYSLANKGKAYSRTPANPFAANINTSSEFGDIEGWSEWIVEDWQVGTGKRRAEEGSVYTHLDTRFPNQIILPLGIDYPLTKENLSGGVEYAAGDLTVDGTTIVKAATRFVQGTTEYNLRTVWVYVDAPDGTTITLEIYSSNVRLPNASLSSGTATITKLRPGPIWQRVEISGVTLAASTGYFVVISADDTLTVPKYTPRSAQNGATYDGSAWTSQTYGFGFLTSFVTGLNNFGLQNGTDSLLQQDGDEFSLPEHGDRLAWIVRARGQLFGAYNNQLVEIVNGALTVITTTGTTAITDVALVGEVIYIAHGTGYKTYTVATSTVATVAATPTDLFHLHGGYLYRAAANDLYYTTDGTNWTQVDDPVGWDGWEIRGMAGLNGDLYLSTDEGLFMLAPGDFIRPLKKWPTISSNNGRNMTEWNGALYIPLSEDIVRFDATGTMMQIGLRTGEDLPSDIQGLVYDLHSTPYFLLASMQPSQTNATGSLWAWNGQGWHNIGLLPQDVRGGAIMLDSENGYLYWGGSYGLVGRAIYPSNVVNPIRDSGAKLFNRTGWLEYDRFYGGHVALDKDFESVYIDTEEMGNATIAVYWKDQDSTDWELLNTSTAEDFELRWSDYDTRPNSKWLRLGILFRTDDEQDTPIIRAHRLKFHPMIADRWRWQLGIEISPKQQLPDGDLQKSSSDSVDEMTAHLDSMIKRVPPCILRDVDGTYYEVKVLSAPRRIDEYEYYDGEAHIKYAYDLTLEQVNDSAYTP